MIVNRSFGISGHPEGFSGTNHHDPSESEHSIVAWPLLHKYLMMLGNGAVQAGEAHNSPNRSSLQVELKSAFPHVKKQSLRHAGASKYVT